MEIKITSGLSLRDRKSIIEAQIKKNQLLVILEIGEDDAWQSYPELIGKTGKFISSETEELKETFYSSVFKLDKPIEINVFDSVSLQDTFFFTDAIFGIVHTDMNTLTEEISVHQGTDHENASDKLKEGSAVLISSTYGDWVNIEQAEGKRN